MEVICIAMVFCATVLSQYEVPIVKGSVSKWPEAIGEVILSHSYNEGQYFYQLEKFDKVWQYKNGTWIQYSVKEKYWMQAIPSQSLQPQLIDLATQEIKTVEWVYANIYNKGLTLQTCFTRENDTYWGRLFITTERTRTWQQNSMMPFPWVKKSSGRMMRLINF